LLNNFNIAETNFYKDKLNKPEFKRYYSKINALVYSILRNNPYFGRNIKKLKGAFNGIYRYRIGDLRIFYKIDEDKVIVFMIDIEWRKDAYR